MRHHNLGENADLGKLQVNPPEEKKYSITHDCACSVILNFPDKMARSTIADDKLQIQDFVYRCTLLRAM